MYPLVTMLISASSLATNVHAGHDRAVQPGDLPPPVVKALNERYPGARTLTAEREDKKDRVEFEVDLCHEGRRIEVELTADGRIEEVEDEGAC